MTGYNGDNFVITDIQDLYDLMAYQIVEVSDVKEALRIYYEGGHVDWRQPMAYPVLIALRDSAITVEGAVDCIEAMQQQLDATYDA